MAKADRNVMMRGLQGSVGEQVVLKADKAGRTIVSNKPVFREDWVFTAAQCAQQRRFRAARAYARGAKHLAIYQARAEGTPQTPSNVAMTDWFHPPEIREIDLSEWRERAGGVIRVRAVDDVMVKQVWVTILDEAGEVVEEGEGVRGEGDWWAYHAAVPAAGNLKVLVRADDLPGHQTEIVKSLGSETT